ncbi:MAG TPA: hypothetical protein VLG13_01090 [Patescibacteria group bacterium]|nr:hypothetical protein [Patescibacteria group bacterium]
MHLLRRSAYHFVSVLLFTFLVLTAWTTTATLTFGKPDRLESWLSQSKLYDHFVATAIDQSNKSVKNSQNVNDNSGGLSLSDPGVQQAVKGAFTPATIQGAVNTVLNANYAWLEGKTATPEFSVDLSQQKATLAANLGTYAQTRAASLPRCASLSQVNSDFDPLSATCLPLGVTPAAAGQLAQQKIANSQDFLANPVITAQNLTQMNKRGDQSKQPYYQKLSQLPKAYRAATKLPWLVAALAVLSGVGVVFLAATRRKGMRRIGTLLVAGGLVILLLILASNVALHRVENKAFTNDKVGQLQQSLVDFAHRAQSFLARVDLWFGIGFVVAGITIWLLLKFVWPATKMPKANVSQPDGPDSPKPTRPSKKIIPIQL